MNYYFRYGVVTAALFFLTGISIVGKSDGKDLRPTEHGLAYQRNSPPAGKNSSEKMLSFFGGGGEASSVSLPEARNLTDPMWNVTSSGGEERRRHGGYRVRLVLLTATLVCGITGVILLSVAAFVFMFRKPPLPPPPQRSAALAVTLPLPPPSYQK